MPRAAGAGLCPGDEPPARPGGPSRAPCSHVGPRGWAPVEPGLPVPLLLLFLTSTSAPPAEPRWCREPGGGPEAADGGVRPRRARCRWHKGPVPHTPARRRVFLARRSRCRSRAPAPGDAGAAATAPGPRGREGQRGTAQGHGGRRAGSPPRRDGPPAPGPPRRGLGEAAPFPVPALSASVTRGEAGPGQPAPGTVPLRFCSRQVPGTELRWRRGETEARAVLERPPGSRRPGTGFSSAAAAPPEVQRAAPGRARRGRERMRPPP